MDRSEDQEFEDARIQEATEANIRNESVHHISNGVGSKTDFATELSC